MLIKKGIPVSPGVAIFPAVVLDAEDQPIPRRTIPPSRVPIEHQRLDQALEQSIQEVQQLREQTASSLGQELANIFSFHIGMLHDQHLIRQIRGLIDNERTTAEYAVYQVLHRLGQTFLQHESKYLRERVSDVWDLERRILKHLIGYTHTQLHQLKSPAVVIAHDLTPSQTASLDKNKIKGIATDAGGRTSHTAILAHAL
ncbi:MAG TPA: phosphoenolpyruvate-utilizing N-terminal domain-containing protein, partial [Phycisphaeraceae bacterium]